MPVHLKGHLVFDLDVKPCYCCGNEVVLLLRLLEGRECRRKFVQEK